MSERELSDLERTVRREAIIAQVARVYRWRLWKGIIPAPGRLLR